MATKTGKAETTKSGKKVKDKWKLKKTYKIIAPPSFEGVTIGTTLAEEPEQVLGRTVVVSAQELTGDISKVYIKIKFKVIDHKEGSMYTRFYGMDITSDYLRRLTRRKRSKIDYTVSATTLDNGIIKFKVLLISEKKLQSSVKANLRNAVKDYVKDYVAKNNYDAIPQQVLSGEVAKNIATAIKKIYNIKKIEVRKIEVLSLPTGSAQPQLTEEKGEQVQSTEQNESVQPTEQEPQP
jgi:small subunit ribosomal protein S3Ae